jgi:autotransporter translocation and assembly factor TamB
VSVVSLSGEYGAAPFSASGTLDFTGEQVLVDFQLSGKGLLLARDEGLRLRADAELALSGELRALKLSGELILVEGRYSKDFALLPINSVNRGPRPPEIALPFLRQAPWSDLELDVRVSAQRPVRVETNIARGTLDPKLHLRGSGSAPRLGGSILIGAMRVKLPGSSVEVNTGVVTFSDETRLVPELSISATTRLRGYDVTAQVSGTSEEPEVFFSSSPPLASEEIAILVITGQLPESALTSSGSTDAAQTMATYLGRDLLTRWLGSDDDTEDPFSERLEFYQGVEVSQAGIESAEVVFRLTPRPRGKSRLLYLRAERDIYERINFGVKLVFRFQ